MSLLDNLSGVPGVLGAALFEADEICIESTLPAPYEAPFVADVVRQLLVANMALDFVDETPLETLFLRFTGGSLAVRTYPRHRVITIADSTLNPLMLNVALGALENHLRRSPAPLPTASTGPVPAPVFQEIPSSAGAPAFPTQTLHDPFHTQPQLSSPSSRPPEIQHPPFQVPSSQPPAFRRPISSTPAAASPCIDSIPETALSGLHALAPRYLGPLGSRLVSRTISRMGCDGASLPDDVFMRLVAELAAKIARPDLRAQFEKSSLALLKRGDDAGSSPS